MSKRTKAEINREIDRWWNDALEHGAAAHAAYMQKLDFVGCGDAGMENAARRLDGIMKKHERAARDCRAEVNRLGDLRRELFGR